MKFSKLTKILCICLVLGVLSGSVVSCASEKDDENEKNSGQEQDSELESSEPDPLAELDFGGKEFHINTSVNIAAAGMGNSNFMIEGDAESSGADIVSSAVHTRNLNVEEKLGIKLVFTQSDLIYTEVAPFIEIYIRSGENDYHLFINDLYPLVGLSASGYFLNVNDFDDSYFDFDQNYWYDYYMKDISLHENYRFILAGDYFIDVIRSAHCLIYNKNIYNDIFGDPNKLYETVNNYEWTYEKWLQLINESYIPANGANSEPDPDSDQFGLVLSDLWGSMIPMIVSGGCDYMTRNAEGYPEIDMNTDRVLDLSEAIYNIAYADGTIFNLDENEVLKVFTENRSLFIGYQRLGSIENAMLRDMPSDSKGIIPYPMLKASEKKYTTSSHDTAEVGAIPNTVNLNELGFVSAVIEALCRETSEVVMPEYYETALKVKYASDENAAAMIDIIHDNFGNVFQLAYDINLGDLAKKVIYESINNGNISSVTSTLQRSIRSSRNSLERIIKNFQKNN